MKWNLTLIDNVGKLEELGLGYLMMMKCWRRPSTHYGDAIVALPSTCMNARLCMVTEDILHVTTEHQELQDSRENPSQLSTPSKTLHRKTPMPMSKVPTGLSPSKTLYRETPVPRSEEQRKEYNLVVP
jgi:hypothetical protein